MTALAVTPAVRPTRAVVARWLAAPADVPMRVMRQLAVVKLVVPMLALAAAHPPAVAKSLLAILADAASLVASHCMSCCLGSGTRSAPCWAITAAVIAAAVPVLAADAKRLLVILADAELVPAADVQWLAAHPPAVAKSLLAILADATADATADADAAGIAVVC